jgi:hypothetical protein
MSPKIRESLYYLGTIVTGVLGIALIWGGIDAGAADSIGDILAGFLALIGASAPAVAAKKINEQRRDGTLDVVSPADAVVNGVQAVIQAQANANAELDKVKQAVTSAVGVIPGIGPLAAQIINSVPTAYNQYFDPNQLPYNR